MNGGTPKPVAYRLDVVAVLMGMAFAFMWSSAFTSAKVALADAPPLLMLVVRFALSGALAIAIGRALGQKMPTRPRDWAFVVLLGVCQNSLYLGLFFVAMTTVPAGLAAIIASTMPLLVAAAGPLFLGDRLAARAWVGLVVGFAGAILILGDRIGGDLDPFGLAICLIGVSALAGATLIVRYAQLEGGLVVLVGLQMLVGGLALAPIALATETFRDVTITPSLVIAFTYTTLVPGVLATILWFQLIRRVGAAQASAYHFLNPGFGVVVAWLVLGERVTGLDVVGVCIVAAGILLVQTAPRR
ncbi:MAG: DMT family transporter [Pseudomonadota bacterium]